VVLNGFELGSGSIRIHDPGLQQRVLDVLGIGSQEAGEKFGHMLEAFRYGVPPHGGFAAGMDRIVMLLAGRDNIRDTIAFPKTASAVSLMDGSPSEVDDATRKELGIRIGG